MDEAEFDSQVASLFGRVLAAADAVDPDLLEAEGTAEMVTLSSAASSEKVVLTTQRTVRQVWVAGKSQGIHFSYSPEQLRWLDDRGRNIELVEWIRSCVLDLCGVELGL